MKSRWTVLLIPGDNTGMKKLELSPLLLRGAALLFIALLIFSGVSGYRLYTLRSDLSRVATVKRINVEQSRQLAVLAGKVQVLDEEMNSLRTYNRHLSTLAKVDLDTGEEIVAVGGGEAGSGGRSSNELLTDKMLTRQLHSQIKQIEDDVDVERSVSRDLLAEVERQRSLTAHTPSLWPSRGWISSRYGWRSSPFTGRRQFHKGIDIAARMKTPIFAPADGVVTTFRRNGGYGNFLVINHGYGIVTRYGHLNKSLVTPGQQVKKGQKIALIGSTGRSTGPHVHYEVLVGGIHVNPQRYMLK